MRALTLAPLLLAVVCCKADRAGSSSPPEAAASPPAKASVAGQIVHLKADQVVATEPVPASSLGHGEAVRAIWTADDGTTYLAGYLYVAGRPPPGAPPSANRTRDTGVVYRRAPDGRIDLVYTKPETELGRVWGRSSRDVYVGGVQTLVHFDGEAWSEVAIPQLEGSISGIWSDATDLWVSAGHQYNAFIHHRDGKYVWSVELKAPVMLFNLGGAGTSVWAVGSSGAIFQRDHDGHWKREAEDRNKQYASVWASAPDDVYAAGSDLVHSTGDGKWTPVVLPASGPLRYVWGRGKDDVFAGVPGGLLHLTGGAWQKTGFAEDSAGVSGTGADLFVAHNDLR